MSERRRIKKPARYFISGPFCEKQIVEAIHSYLRDKKFKVSLRAENKYYHVDISAYDKSSNAWIIEAKGKSTAPRGDVLEGLGQLLNIMEFSPNGMPKAEYYLALPNLNQWRKQASKVSTYVRRRIGLGFLFVDAKGNVERLTPSQPVTV